MIPITHPFRKVREKDGPAANINDSAQAELRRVPFGSQLIAIGRHG